MVRELATTIKSGDKVEVEGHPIYNEERFTICLTNHVEWFQCDRWQGPQDCCGSSYLMSKNETSGRLDWDTSGVLILTNDGALRMKWFTHVMRLTRSMSRVLKVYIMIISALDSWSEIDGKKTKPLFTKFQSGSSQKRSVVQLTIHEGRNHQVKKMFEAVGLRDSCLDTFWHLDPDRSSSRRSLSP